jgi:hypothetical protein
MEIRCRPAYPPARIAQAHVGLGEDAARWPHVNVLAGMTVLFLALARRRLAGP